LLAAGRRWDAGDLTHDLTARLVCILNHHYDCDSVATVPERVKAIGFARRDEAEVGAGYAAPTCTLDGDGSSWSARFDGFSLWVTWAEVAAGGELTWSGHHGDEGLYVVDGELEFAGSKCPTGGAVIIESGVPARVRVPNGAAVVHFGPEDPEPPANGVHGPPAPEPRGVHLVGPGGVWAATEPGRDTRMFADSTCPTCRITLFLTGRDQEYRSSAHSHSADEILYLLRGRIHFGSYQLGPGDCVAIRGGQRYQFRSGPDGFAFLNYRRDASEQTTEGAGPQLEGGKVRDLTFVDDSQYREVPVTIPSKGRPG
jgi:mannose-6-phosphate isomerase-like protein (cupin superfamily)